MELLEELYAFCERHKWMAAILAGAIVGLSMGVAVGWTYLY